MSLLAGQKARSAVFALNVPAIHVFQFGIAVGAWMPGTLAGMTNRGLG